MQRNLWDITTLINAKIWLGEVYIGQSIFVVSLMPQVVIKSVFAGEDMNQNIEVEFKLDHQYIISEGDAWYTQVRS